MTDNPHFASPASWAEAAALVPFEPIARDELDGRPLLSLAVFLRDHELREVAPGERSLEAHYDGFSFCQSRPGVHAARRRALESSYGPDSRDIDLGDPGEPCEARAYELGPEPEPDDPDPRMPAVVTWAVDDRFYLLASDAIEAEELIGIARSLYGNAGGE